MGGCEAAAEEWFPRGKDELKVLFSAGGKGALPVGYFLSGQRITGRLFSDQPADIKAGDLTNHFNSPKDLMDNPTHTAKWIQEEVHKLLNSDPENDHGTISVLLIVLDRLNRALGALYRADAYASGKALRAQNFLLQALGAEISGRSRGDNLQHAYEELAVLSRINFVELE